jgi:hypothetical protein
MFRVASAGRPADSCAATICARSLGEPRAGVTFA